MTLNKNIRYLFMNKKITRWNKHSCPNSFFFNRLPRKSKEFSRIFIAIATGIIDGIKAKSRTGIGYAVVRRETGEGVAGTDLRLGGSRVRWRQLGKA